MVEFHLTVFTDPDLAVCVVRRIHPETGLQVHDERTQPSGLNLGLFAPTFAQPHLQVTLHVETTQTLGFDHRQRMRRFLSNPKHAHAFISLRVQRLGTFCLVVAQPNEEN